MKHLLCLLFLYSEISFAQNPVNLPELSPEAKVLQQVGYTTIGIRYGRPAARERKIMGELVPYKKVWRTGAGRTSIISFSDQVMINQVKIPAGTYAIVSIPDERAWTIMLNSDTTKYYGDPAEYDPASEVVRVQVNAETTDRFYESLTIDLDIAKYDAIFYLAWENTQIHFPIATGSHEQAKNAIAKALAADPDNQQLLAQASYYHYMNNEDPQQILAWLNRALDLGGERWLYQQKTDVLIRLKQYTEARQTAKEAIAFLQKTKPVEWQTEVTRYEEQMNHWPIE